MLWALSSYRLIIDNRKGGWLDIYILIIYMTIIQTSLSILEKQFCFYSQFFEVLEFYPLRYGQGIKEIYKLLKLKRDR